MKISKETRDIITNFSTIYGSMLFHKGKVQKTNSPGKSLIASVVLQEDFPQGFAIYDVSQFLNALTVFKDPDIDFDGEDQLILSDGTKKIYYRCCKPDLINKKLFSKDKALKLPTIDVEFIIEKSVLTELLTATRVLALTHIAITGESGRLSVRSINPKDDGFNRASFDMGETDKKFNMIFNVDNIKVLPISYKVSVSKAGLAQFESQEKDLALTYWMPVEKDSKFEG